MKRRNKKSAFDRCVESVAARGSAVDPRAVCATAGVRKFGQAEMTRRAIAGKRRAARRRGNAPRVTQREVDSAAASYHNMLMQYGENNMATQRAEFKYRDLQRAYADQKAKRAARGNPTVAEHKADFYRQGLSAGKKERGQDRPVLGPGRASGQAEFMAQRLVDYYGLPQSKAGEVAAQFTRGYFDGFHGKRGGRRNPAERRYTLQYMNMGAWVDFEPYRTGLMERWRAEKRAGAIARSGRRVRMVDQETGQAEEFEPQRRGRGNPSDEKRSGSRVVRMWSNDGKKWEGRLYVNQGETATTQYKRGVTKGTLDRWAEKVLAGRYNPAEAARAVSEEFHGRAVRAMVPVTERRHYHKFLAELGELTLLVIHTPDGRHRVELTQFAGALLCTNEDKNQLFIKGGDQTVNLRDFGIRDPHEKEHLGELRKIAYYTDKEHLGDEGGEADYHHSFSKPYPHVDFRTRDTHLEISGGKYKITREGIVG